MLVEINLLPQKEPKKIAFIVTLASLLVILLLSGAYFLWQMNSTKSEIHSVDRQITMTKKITDKLSNAEQAANASSSASQLKTAIDWANNYPIQTIPVMRYLTSLLPERGFIQNFGYTEAGTISLTVQFDSEREAAYFLENLNESKWIQAVNLSSLTAAATTSQDSTTGTSSTATGQSSTSNTATGTADQTNGTNTNTVSTGNSNTAAASTDNGTQSANTATSSASTTSAATTTAGTAANTAASNASSNQDANVLPRYSGQFEITLNKDVVKKNISKSKNAKEGVAGS